MLTTLFVFLASAATVIHQKGSVLIHFDDQVFEVVKQSNEQSISQLIAGLLFSFQEKDTFEKYRSRFSVVSEDASAFQTQSPSGLHKYRNYAVDFLKGQRFQITSRKEVQLGPYSALEVTGHQRDFGLTYRQWIVLEGRTAYLLTASARLSRFEKLSDLFQVMAHSFKPLSTIKQVR